ncbi:MAG: heme exporter protein CcmB [Pseudomonadota bacterium]
MNLWALLVRDVRLAWAAGGGGPVGVIFYLSVATVAPFAVGPDLPLLSRLGPALLWIAVLLSLLLGLERLFQSDEEDGTLDQLRLCATPLSLVVLTKALAHWVASALPLIVATPAAAILLNMEMDALALTVIGFLVGTPGMALIGTVGAAVAVSVRRGGVLIAILVLPLSIPLVIFGVSVVDTQLSGGDPAASLALLGAVSLVALVVAPPAAAAALRAIE